MEGSEWDGAPAPAPPGLYQELLRTLGRKYNSQTAGAELESARGCARADAAAAAAPRASESPGANVPERLKLKMKKGEESGLWQCAAAADAARAQAGLQEVGLARLLQGVLQHLNQTACERSPPPARAHAPATLTAPAPPAPPDSVSYEKYLKQTRNYAVLLEEYRKLQSKYEWLERESRWLADRLEQGAFADRAVAAGAPTAPPPAAARHAGAGAGAGASHALADDVSPTRQ